MKIIYDIRLVGGVFSICKANVIMPSGNAIPLPLTAVVNQINKNVIQS